MPKDRFYEFDHECEKMPENVSFCHIKGCRSTQFTFSKYVDNIGLSSTTLYGFDFCPYCGKDMRDAD